MKQLLFLFLISSQFLNCTIAQTPMPSTLGIGVISALEAQTFTEQGYFKDFFADPQLTKPIATTQGIVPFNNFVDYGIYQFICLEVTPKYYKILINNTETAYIYANAPFVFQDWTSFLLNKSVVRKTKTDPIIGDPISDKNPIVHTCSEDYLKVVGRLIYNGKDWLQVSFAPTCEDYPTPNTPLKYGWIEWIEDRYLLIDIPVLD